MPSASTPTSERNEGGGGLFNLHFRNIFSGQQSANKKRPSLPTVSLRSIVLGERPPHRPSWHTATAVRRRRRCVAHKPVQGRRRLLVRVGGIDTPLEGALALYMGRKGWQRQYALVRDFQLLVFDKASDKDKPASAAKLVLDLR